MYYNNTPSEYDDGKHYIRARVQEEETTSFTFTVESKEYPHETHIYKKDITTGEELPGATLQVLASDDNIVEEWVSDEEPHDIIALHDETQGLKDGKYILREYTAPYGYDNAEDAPFEIKADTIENTVTMQNKPITIGTVALDEATKTHHGIKSPETTITDTVKITGLYKKKTIQMEEDSIITLNPNNGEKPVEVKIETATDLGDYSPERTGASFKGWTVNDGVFSAGYKTEMASIQTGNKAKKIGN